MSDLQDISVVQVPESKEKLVESDRHVLDMAKMKRSLALANAEKALAQNEAAELGLNNIVLQLTMKYNLTEKDTINEQGEILRNFKESK